MLLAFLGRKLQSCWQLPSAPVYCNSSKWCQQPLGCIRKRVASRSREVIIPICSALVDTSGVLAPVLGSPVQHRQEFPGASQQRAMNMMKGLEPLMYEDRLREIGVFSREKKSRGRFDACVWIPTVVTKEDEVRLWVVSSKRIRGIWHKWKYKKYHFTI